MNDDEYASDQPPSMDVADAIDLSKWYTMASNNKGMRDKVSLYLPPSVTGAVASLVQSRQIPELTTSSDVYRDGIVIAAAIRAKQTSLPEYRRIYDVAMAEARVAQLWKEHNDHAEIVKTYDRLLSEARSTKTRQGYLNEAKRALETMTLDEFKDDLARLIARYSQ